MKITNISAIIFDLGGTLYKPGSDLCGLTRQFMSDVRLADIAKHTDDHIKSALSAPDKWLWDLMIENNVPMDWEPTAEVWIEYDKILLSALGVSSDLDALAAAYQDRWDRFFEDNLPELMEGVKETLEALQSRGFKLGIASNRFSSPTELLTRDDIIHFFDVIEYTNVPGYAKPSPYMLIRAADRLQINPRKCAYVGNIADNDLIAASRAEMVPILLSWCDPEEVEKVSTDTIVIEHISDLLEIL
jgi:HAD superfamily hydrolase (TIGR01549 family)